MCDRHRGISFARPPALRRPRRTWVIAVGLTLVPLAAGYAQPQTSSLLGPYLTPADVGQVDWSTGTLRVEGFGRARGQDAQARLMACRAGEVIAARNAMALARGIGFDQAGRIRNVGHGLLRVRGMMRGHRIVRTEWHPDRNPPECTVTLRVPLWGVRGVAWGLWRYERARSRRSGLSRVPLTTAPAANDPAPNVICIDARGMDVSPSVFPAIVDDRGRVLHDLTRISPTMAGQTPVLRYAVSKVSFDTLTRRDRLDLRWLFDPDQSSVTTTAAETTEISSLGDLTVEQLVERRRVRRVSADDRQGPQTDWRRARILTFRALGTDGPERTHIVLADDAIRRLSRDPRAVAALGSGHVLVLLDRAE